MMQQSGSGWLEFRQQRGRWIAVAASMALLASTAHAVTSPTPTPSTVDTVTVQVVNALSGQPLASLPIQGKRIDGSLLTWVASATTDAAAARR